MKVCNRCGLEKEVECFGKDKNSKDGLYSICKECKHQYYMENKEIITLKHKEYNELNKQQLSDYHRRWYNENKDRQKLIRRNRYLRNRNKELDQGKKYKNDNIELCKLRIMNYRNGYSLYTTFSKKLTTDENPILSKDGIYLEVKCKYCGKYFKPTNTQVVRRIQALEGQMEGDGSIYCSAGCKKACPIYNQKKYSKGYKKATSREVQSELRKMVLERDNFTCQKCEESDIELHCHHITGVEQNPIESADIDNCITLCKECHREVHKQPKCKYYELRCIK